MRRRVLVTGAAGFLGRHLLPVLAASHEVFALVREATGEEYPEHIHEIAADLTGDFLPVLPPRIDRVLHLAQSRHYRSFPERADDIVSVNVDATARLLDYAHGAGAAGFVLASTGTVYGAGDKPFAESDPARPEGFYARTKQAAELLAGGYSSLMAVVILRPFALYGEGQQDALVATLLRRVLADEPIVIRGDPGIRLNPLHVDDAVRAFAAATGLRRSAVVNLAGDESLDLTALVELMRDITGSRSEISYAPADRAGDLVGSNDLMKQLLGVTPGVDLRSGLARLARP